MYKNRSIFYVFMMVMFGIFTYLFLYSGYASRTKFKVNYHDISDVNYKVYLLENDVYEAPYLDKGQRYIADLTDTINLNYKYKTELTEIVSGYYKYSISAKLKAYQNNITDVVWIKNYKLLDDVVKIIDINDTKEIVIDDNILIDYKKYYDVVKDFIDTYDINVYGNLEVDINVQEYLSFLDMEKPFVNSRDIVVNIPVNVDTYKITVDNVNETGNYYEYSNKLPMNLFFTFLGVFSAILTLVFLGLVIRESYRIYKRQNKYKRKLRKLLRKYEEVIIKVDKFYYKKKYNMIYVDSFGELVEVSNKHKKVISFKEVKRGYESIFVIVDDDNAWIYRLIADK